MRILYGVCGEGFGHSSRAKEIITYLQKKGHQVKVITYGQAYGILKEEGFDIIKVEGLHIVFRKNSVDFLETVKQNTLNMVHNLEHIGFLKRMMSEFKPNACFSDMEALVPILSFWYRLPLISIDNQHRITNLKLNVPKRYFRDYLIAKLVIRGIVSRADYFLVTSFASAPLLKKNTLIVPPILRKEIMRMRPRDGRKILVYLTKPDERIIEILKKRKEHFVVYGFKKRGLEGNVLFKEVGGKFLSDLKNCRAVIATAGFTLISEALFLHKPYFALPLPGQFEQALNALFLKQSGYGEYADNLKGLDKKLDGFLSALPFYSKRLKDYKRDNQKIFKELDYVLRWLSKLNKKMRKN